MIKKRALPALRVTFASDSHLLVSMSSFLLLSWFLDSTCKWGYEVFVFFCLTFHSALKGHSCCHQQVSLFFCGWIISVYAHVCLTSSFSHVSIGTWAASESWLLWQCRNEHGVRESFSVLFSLEKCPEMELLDHIVVLFLVKLHSFPQ